MDQLFYKVFKNIYLNKLIFNNVKLYNKNEIVIFTNRNELNECNEKEFISELVYQGRESLQVGDLPIGGVLKRVEFTERELIPIKYNVIPYGVQELDWCFTVIFGYGSTSFKSLPSTINKLNGVVIKIPESDNGELINSTTFNFNEYYQIPSNITSISFSHCPTISGSKGIKGINKNEFITIPNTIRSLTFSYRWSNTDTKLKKGDLPEGITYLSMKGIQISTQIIGILPSTIKELQLYSNLNQFIPYEKVQIELFTFNFLSGLNNLEIFQFEINFSILKQHNLSRHKSIKQLHLSGIRSTFGIEPNSLPPNLLKLKLDGISELIQVDSIPDTVTHLHFEFVKPEKLISVGSIPNSVLELTSNHVISKPGIFPSSLQSFQLIKGNTITSYLDELSKMISILPPSLNTLILPSEFFETISNLQFPNHINVQYN